MSRYPTRQDLLHAFARADPDGSNTADVEALKSSLIDIGLPPKTARTIVGKIDLNQNGTIQLGEYKVCLGLTEVSHEEWRRLYESMDRNGSGSITVSDMKRMFTDIGLTMSTTLLEGWIEDHDRNQDGTVDYQEFLAYIASYAEGSA